MREFFHPEHHLRRGITKPYGDRDFVLAMAQGEAPQAALARAVLLMNDDLRLASFMADRFHESLTETTVELMRHQRHPWREALRITWRKAWGKP